MNLGVFKGKQVAAKKGYDLLKSKADALKVWLNFLSPFPGTLRTPQHLALFLGAIS